MSTQINLWTTAEQQGLTDEQFEFLKEQIKTWVGQRWPRASFSIVEKTHGEGARAGWRGEQAWRAAIVEVGLNSRDCNVEEQKLREDLLEFVNDAAENIQDAA